MLHRGGSAGILGGVNMAKGKQLDAPTVYSIMASYFITGNTNDTARALNMPQSTVCNIVNKNKDKEEFVKLGNEKREEFTQKATEIIDIALKRLKTTIEDKEIDIPVNQLTTAIGTLYDKRALARGESTENTAIVVKFNDEMKEWAK